MELIHHQRDPHVIHGDQPSIAIDTDPGMQAIAYAKAARFDSDDMCFRVLYDYGSEPLSVVRANSLTARLPVLSETTVAILAAHYHRKCMGNWDVWTRTSVRGNPIYKTYFNPFFDDFQQFCLRIGPMLLDRRVAAFKTVTERWLAVRPDKFIVYFTSPLSRQGWLDDLPVKLTDLRSNPTPFTQNWSADGFVTIATDPKESPGESWRSTLLQSISSVITTQPDISVDGIKSQLAADGIDVNTWSRTNV